MKVKILASGSSGNVTAVETETELILLDCGKPLQWTLKRLEYKLPTAILLTHEHGDHAHAVTSFLKRGVEVYMTAGTKRALGLSKRHNLHEIPSEFLIGEVRVKAISAIHDAAEPVNFILSDATERILYATDTGAMPTLADDFTKILIEANYSEAVLIGSDVEELQKRRVLENHLSIEQAITFLQGIRAEEIHLIHISKRHGDAAQFISRAKAETGMNIFRD